MKFNKQAQIAIAVGWFVLLDILLRTTEGAIGYANTTANSIRGIIYGFRYSDIVLVIALVGLISLVLLALLLLLYLWRAWTSVIGITRNLVSFFFFEDSVSKDEVNIDKQLLHSLFGSDNKLKDGLLWKTLSNLLMIWVILLLSAIIVGVINVLSRY